MSDDYCSRHRREGREEEREKSALTLAANEAQTIEVGGGTQSKYDSNHENSSGKIMDNSYMNCSGSKNNSERHF